MEQKVSPNGNTFDYTKRYNTTLSPTYSSLFRRMSVQYPQLKNSSDYDMRGWWLHTIGGEQKGGTSEDVAHKRIQDALSEGGHYDDTWKKPNHHTFSDLSKYHGVDGHEGGVWSDKEDGSGTSTFTAGKTNLAFHGPDELRRYWGQGEGPAGHTLHIPGSGEEPMSNSLRRLRRALRKSNEGMPRMTRRAAARSLAPANPPPTLGRTRGPVEVPVPLEPEDVERLRRRKEAHFDTRMFEETMREVPRELAASKREMLMPLAISAGRWAVKKLDSILFPPKDKPVSNDR